MTEDEMIIILTIGLVAMSLLAAISIFYGFKLSREMNSDDFRWKIFSEVARENHKIYMREVENERV
jgi:hypothetical protein